MTDNKYTDEEVAQIVADYKDKLSREGLAEVFAPSIGMLAAVGGRPAGVLAALAVGPAIDTVKDRDGEPLTGVYEDAVLSAVLDASDEHFAKLFPGCDRTELLADAQRRIEAIKAEEAAAEDAEG